LYFLNYNKITKIIVLHNMCIIVDVQYRHKLNIYLSKKLSFLTLNYIKLSNTVKTKNTNITFLNQHYFNLLHF